MRSSAFESHFLAEVHRAAKSESYDFHGHVLGRLRAGSEEYGESWVHRAAEDLMREMREELVDAPAWAMLAGQSLEDLSEIDRAQVVNILAEASARCLEAHALVELALETLADSRRGA